VGEKDKKSSNLSTVHRRAAAGIFSMARLNWLPKDRVARAKATVAKRYIPLRIQSYCGARGPAMNDSKATHDCIFKVSKLCVCVPSNILQPLVLTRVHIIRQPASAASSAEAAAAAARASLCSVLAWANNLLTFPRARKSFSRARALSYSRHLRALLGQQEGQRSHGVALMGVN